MQACTCNLAKVMNGADQVRTTRDQAAEDIRMTGQKLGGAVYDQVGPERRRALVDRRGEGVVDGDYRPT